MRKRLQESKAMGPSNETRELDEQARIMKKVEGYSLAMRTIIALIGSILGLVYLVITRH